MAPTVAEAIELLNLNDGILFKSATEMLWKIIKNVIDSPQEPKYRSIKRGGTAFANSVGSAKGGVRFLKAVGFVEQEAAASASTQAVKGEAMLVLPMDAPMSLLEQGKDALKQAVKQQQAALDAQRQSQEETLMKVNAAAAEKLANLKAVSKRNSAQRDAKAEEERQRLLRGVQQDKDENQKWKTEYDAMNG